MIFAIYNDDLRWEVCEEQARKYEKWITTHVYPDLPTNRTSKCFGMIKISYSTISKLLNQITDTLISHKLGLDPEAHKQLEALFSSQMYVTRSSIEELSSICVKALNCAVDAEKNFPDSEYGDAYWADLKDSQEQLMLMKAGASEGDTFYFSWQSDQT